MTSAGRLLLLPWLALGLVAAWPAWTPAQTAAPEGCAACHLETGDERLAAPVKSYAQDIHRAKGFGCVACHGETGVGIGDLTLAKRNLPTDSLLEAWIRNPPSPPNTLRKPPHLVSISTPPSEER